MATTTTRKKTTTKTAAPKTETQKTVPSQDSVDKVVKEEPKKEKRVFSPDDGVVCRSVTQGGLYMEGPKTKMHYEWVQYGDVTEVEYADLAALVRVKSQYVFGPWFMIDDDDFVEEFQQLKKFYTDNYSLSDLEKILTYPVDDMMNEIRSLPKTAIESIKVLAASSITDGDLDSVAKIKALDDFFGTKLSILAEFK